jgi:hypothetical protein
MSGPGIPAMRVQGTPAPAPDPRNPDMTTLMDGTGSDIPDADLLTLEEISASGPLEEQGPISVSHDENLVAFVSSSDLTTIADDLSEAIEADLRSRADWYQRFARGLEIVGLKDYVWQNGTAPFEGASTVIAPLMTTAVVQSQARFMEEIFPAQGPCKTVVMGKETPEKREAADRVQKHMNHQLTVEDPIYMPESEKLALYLAIYGSGYRKGYHDYVRDQNLLRFVTAEDLILPYGARNLQSAPRATHRYPVEKNEYILGQRAGAYAQNVQLDEIGDIEQPDEVQQEMDKSDSLTPEKASKDVAWTFYETDLRLVLADDPMADPDGIALPYTVTMEKDSRKIVSIRRNWEEEDPLRLPCVRYAEYWYLPGLGAYGTGLLHWLGTLAEAGTDTLRALLDSATWANLQGGFKAKDASSKAGEIHMRPGQWTDVDMTSDELAKAFHTPPFKEPSEALYKLFGTLVDLAQKFASTTDLLTGQQDAKGAPVGSIVALIEQGMKVYSGIHKRAHFSNGVELRILYKLNAKFIPAEGYEYTVPGEDLAVYQQDYNEKITGAEPVSDPNIFSQTQRIALAQARYQLFRDNPQDFRRTPVLRSLLTALKDPEIDTVLIDSEKLPDIDPVTENAAMATGHPAVAIEGQDHDAHLAVHMAFMQHPQFGGLPQAQQALGPAMIAHIAQHLALKQADIYRGAGVPVPPINIAAPPGTPLDNPDQSPIPANAIAQAAAQMVGAFMQSSGLTIPPADAEKDNLSDDETKANIFKNVAAGVASLAKAGGAIQPGAAQAGQIDKEMQAAAPAPQPDIGAQEAGPPLPPAAQ